MSLSLPTPMSTCPSHFVLDQLALGELEQDSTRELERHLEQCASCQARLSERRASEAAFIVDLGTLRALQRPVTTAACEIDREIDREIDSDVARSSLSAPDAAEARRQRQHSPRLTRWLYRPAFRVVATLAAAAGLTLAVARSGGPDEDVAATDEAAIVGPVVDQGSRVRAKGTSHSALFVKDERGVRGLFDDGDAGTAVVHSGDTLQVAVTSASEVYAAVLSLDQAGTRSTYVASATGGLLRVSPGRNVPLPQATVLDDVAGQETVAVFLCREPGVSTEALQARIDTGEPPPGCVVDRYRLEKKAGR
jgi:hypothetical protein